MGKKGKKDKQYWGKSTVTLTLDMHAEVEIPPGADKKEIEEKVQNLMAGLPEWAILVEGLGNLNTG